MFIFAYEYKCVFHVHMYACKSKVPVGVLLFLIKNNIINFCYNIHLNCLHYAYTTRQTKTKTTDNKITHVRTYI